MSILFSLSYDAHVISTGIRHSRVRNYKFTVPDGVGALVAQKAVVASLKTLSGRTSTGEPVAMTLSYTAEYADGRFHSELEGFDFTTAGDEGVAAVQSTVIDGLFAIGDAAAKGA